jgi:DNA-binding CsgD family transcriptional regulator
MDVALVDRIYESGFVPDLWPEVLRDASKLSGSAGASLFVVDREVSAWTASRNARDVTEKFVSEGWYWNGRLMSRVHRTTHPGFLRDHEICSPEELDDEPIYRDIWRKVGLGGGVATAFDLPTGEGVSIILSRAAAAGDANANEIARLNTLRPHLARSAIFSARMKLERARAAGEAIAALGFPALVFGEAGRVLHANALVADCTRLLHWRAADRITLMDRQADALLTEALARVGTGDHGGARSFPVRRDGPGALLVGHVVPVRYSARDIFARGAALFVLIPATAPAAPPLELMRLLYDLTPAEARVARGLVTGKVVDEIAEDGGVSPNTVRVQVRALLEKTGCRRQTDLVALLGGLSAVRDPEAQDDPS